MIPHDPDRKKSRPRPRPVSGLSYIQLLRRMPLSVRESSCETYSFPYSERHLRCVWFDPSLRPPVLRTHAGEEVLVEDPGRWNLEAGPDFFDAALRIGADRRRITGDVEIHVRPSGWTEHGHAADPAYARIVAHVSYLPGALPAADLPAGAVQISLKGDLAANPFFSFENVDVTAYPYAARGQLSRCAEVLSARPGDDLTAILESAGEERLRVKAERVALTIRERGAEQTLYEELMCALGYKHNRLPFRRLARAVPLADLREEAAGDGVSGYALLAGVSGLLPDRIGSGWDAETRAFVRDVWNRWWKQKSRWEGAVMPRRGWVLSGLRPQNRPLRRLMAAAGLFSAGGSMAGELLAAADGPHEDWLKRAAALLRRGDAGPYWNRRFTFSGAPTPAKQALVGPDRVTAMVTNVVVPFWQASGRGLEDDAELLRLLPAEQDNALVVQTAHALLGRDHNPAVYRTGLRQQGLLQVFHDFCLNDRSGCSECLFLKAVAALPDEA